MKPVAANELRASFRTLAEMALDVKEPARAVRFIGALLPVDADAEAEPRRVQCVKSATEQVEKHFAGKLRQATVAATCGMSSCRFSRAFKAAYRNHFQRVSDSFSDCACLPSAASGLAYRDQCQSCGRLFEDPSHFARAFRKLMHTSPSAYQRDEVPLRPRFERRRRPRTHKAAGVPKLGAVPVVLLEAHGPERDARMPLQDDTIS